MHILIALMINDQSAFMLQEVFSLFFRFFNGCLSEKLWELPGDVTRWLKISAGLSCCTGWMSWYNLKIKHRCCTVPQLRVHAEFSPVILSRSGCIDLFTWIWIQGRSLQEQNQSQKHSWESFAFVDEEDEEDGEKVLALICSVCSQAISERFVLSVTVQSG